jgi:hypothetical protein
VREAASVVFRNCVHSSGAKRQRAGALQDAIAPARSSITRQRLGVR